MLRWLFLIVLVVLAAAAWLGWGLVRRMLLERRVARAWQSFEQHRDAIAAQFLAAASASGKPRGLAWKQCDFHEPLVLTRDRANGQLIGLVAVTISFAAIAGGGMEDVEAVGNLRAATAVLAFDGHQWTSQGRVVFNLEPHEVIERYRGNLDPLTL